MTAWSRGVTRASDPRATAKKRPAKGKVNPYRAIGDDAMMCSSILSAVHSVPVVIPFWHYIHVFGMDSFVFLSCVCFFSDIRV